MKNSQKGSAAIWAIVVLTIIILSIGGYFYLRNNSAQKEQVPVNSPVQINTNSQSQPPTEAVNSPTTNAPKTWSNNTCDYFTLADAKSILSEKSLYLYQNTDQVCVYGYGSVNSSTPVQDKTLAASLEILSANANSQDFNIILNTYAKSSPLYLTQISGIGDQAAWRSLNNKVVLYFAIGKTIGIIYVYEPGIVDQNLSKAENIAKVVIPRLPN